MIKRVALLILGVLLLASASTTVVVAGASLRGDQPCVAALSGSSSGNILCSMLDDRGDRAAFPHSGTQIAIAAVVVVVLLVGGIALWYFSHPRKRKSEDSEDKGPKDKD